MDLLLELWPWLATMAALILGSAFFSASETALFYLRRHDRRHLLAGNPSQRAAARLLSDPERLLTAVLFWNLAINIVYFALVSIVALRLRKIHGDSAAALFGMGGLLLIIFLSEMLPKSLAVLAARLFASIVGLPLSIAVRLLDPLMPLLKLANLLSRRLIWPRFRAEPYLQVNDLERAIERSTTDEELLAHERTALKNIVRLSDIRANEWMRPRSEFQTFAPPVSLEQLDGKMTPSGYLLIQEVDSEEVAAAIDLKDLVEVPQENIELLAQPVVYVPWCASVAEAFQEMQQRRRDVAVVVNEFGESIGILTLDDILDSVFTDNPTRSGRLLDRAAIEEVRPGVWRVSGLTSVRRLGEFLEVELPEGKSVTVAGVVEESLSRLAQQGDECLWGPFRLQVVDLPERGPLIVELTRHEVPDE